MGADLIGYFYYVPDKIDKADKKRIREYINKQLQKIKTISEKIPEDDDDYQLTQKDEEILQELDPEYLPNFHSPIDSLEGLKDAFQLAKELLDNNNFANLNDRNLVRHTIKLFNNRVHIFFCGEMSYGDEPEGEAYETIKALTRTGIAGLLQDICFPDNKAKHYFK